jgi:hypothetical protein
VAGAGKVSPGVVTHRVVLLGGVSIIDPLSIGIIDELPIGGRDIEASVSVPD